jgi:membrane associated rhomboid family serine protease
MPMSITLLLILVTAGTSFYAWNNADIYNKWIMNPYLVKKNKEYLRFLTSGFIHADIPHLVFNMISLFFAGQFLEQVFENAFGLIGAYIYLGLYLLGIIVSDIPTFLKNNRNYNYNSLGASGGVSAVLFSFIIIAPVAIIRVYFIPMPAFVFGILYLVYSYVQADKESDNINHDAHFYGAAFGILFTIIVMPEVIFSFLNQIVHWKVFG